jgi:hypothetical protein
MATGVVCIVVFSVILAFGQHSGPVLIAQLLLSSVGPFIASAITAITLGRVGSTHVSCETPASIGGQRIRRTVNGLDIGWHWSVQAIFFTVQRLPYQLYLP